MIDPYYSSQQDSLSEHLITVNSKNVKVRSSKVEINNSPKYQDVWATVIYVLVVLITLVIAGISIPHMDTDKLCDGCKRKRNSSGNSTSDMIIMLSACLISSILFTMIYMVLMQRFAGKMIIGTFIISIILNLIYAIITFFINFIMGFVMIFFAFLYILCFFLWRSRIPFAKVMLTTVTTVTKKYPATIFFGFMGCLIGAIWYGIIGITLIASITYFNELIGGTSYVIYVFLLFSFYLSAQVINNTVHVTISGLFATYYFCGITQSGSNKIQVNVKNPTLKSFKRAITTSFGSICFGSIVIAVFQTLRALAQSAKNDAQEDGNCLLVILMCCIECILSCISDMIEYFNVYAFTEVAIYGKSYCQAAKDTWELCKSYGIDAVINDSLISNVLSIGSLTIGCLSAVIVIVIGFILGISNAISFIIYGIIAFLMGCMIFSVVAQVINSGVATTFVCLCEDPETLRYTKPELWEKIKDTYPSVLI
ncbi:DUF580-domain-containing protein [Piromyces finnis]|uniref:Protein PNS1 n=1 Tax=Piromyces finnis TaxID=1754191 RepID=A0A1Y1V397_9FUNG|nr:DUF580-domain-containing protein [Piromyces finnis]|eukprot:ORX46163.1 DUF580-domain-containing protein [Piromyces finnis]